MDSENRASVTIRIFLPVLFLLLVNIAPLPHRYARSLREARQAEAAGQPALAAARLEQAIELMSWRQDLLEPLARLELEAGREEQALMALRQARQAGQLSIESHFTLGEIYLLRGEPEAALEVWQDLAARPDFAGNALAPRLWEQVYHLERARYHWEEAIRALQFWRSVAPDNTRVLFLLGLHLSATHPDQALPLLLEASQRDSQYTEPVQALRGGINQASVADDRGYGWVMIGRALGRLKEWDLALLAFDQAVQASPEYAEAWAFLAEARYQNGLAPQKALEKAQALNPQSVVVQAMRALHLRRSGQPGQAESLLQEVARQEPDEAIWLVELGNTLVEKGDLVAARAYFYQALELEPRSIPILKAVVAFSVQYNVEPRDLGLPVARQLVLLSPEDPESLDLMGQVLMRLEDLTSAERFLQQALEKETSFAAAYLHLGQLYLQRDDPTRALFCLRQAVALNHDDTVGSIARRLLLRYFNEGG